MTKKEKEILEEVLSKIERIVNWDNKNLKKNQYYDLDDCVQDLAKVLKKEED